MPSTADGDDRPSCAASAPRRPAATRRASMPRRRSRKSSLKTTRLAGRYWARREIAILGESSVAIHSRFASMPARLSGRTSIRTRIPRFRAPFGPRSQASQSASSRSRVRARRRARRNRARRGRRPAARAGARSTITCVFGSEVLSVPAQNRPTGVGRLDDRVVPRGRRRR